MSHDLDFIWDLLDEGLLPSEFAAEHYHYNDTLIGENNTKLYDQLIGYRCAINQSSLSRWTWLLGGAGGGSFKPLLCAARRRDNCSTNNFFEAEFAHLVSLEVLVALCCLFALVNLFTLAVWSRCKSPPAQGEVGIQLFMLRLFSILDIAGCLAPVFQMLMYISGSKSQVLSVLHAILLASFINFCSAVYRLYLLMKSFWTLLSSIYLLEHSCPAQRVLLFASLRRAQVLLAAPLLICLVPCAFHYLFLGSLYCVHDGTAYLMSDYYQSSYPRLPGQLYYRVRKFAMHTQFALELLALILLTVFASKRHCAFCRGSPSPGQTSDSVAYVPQRDEDVDDEEEETLEPSVVIERGSSTTVASTLTDELRRLILWQQVACACRGILYYISDQLSRRLSHYISHKIIMHYYLFELVVDHAAMYGLAALLSAILSGTFRAGVVSVLGELRTVSVRLSKLLFRCF